MKFFSIIFLFLLTSYHFVWAQYSYNEIKSTNYKYIGTSNKGTEIIFAIHLGMNDDKQNFTSYVIVDIYGLMMISEKVADSQKNIIELGKLENGTYLLILYQENNIFGIKSVILIK